MSDPILASTQGSSSGSVPAAARRRNGWLLIFLAVGIGWRVIRYALDFPLRGDEAMLAVNLLDRGPWDFWRPLEYQQVAPPLFMILTQLLRQMLGSSEWVLRLMPLTAGIGGLGLLYAFARRHLARAAGAIALGLCAVSLDPVMHAVDFKPYALDLAWGAAYVWCGWRLIQRPDCARIWLILLLIMPVALTTSFATIFLLPALSLVSLKVFFTRSAWRFKAAYAACQVVTCATLYLVLRINSSDQGRQTMQFMDDFWSRGFPPPLNTVGGWVRLPVWLYQSQVRVVMGYPVAQKEILGILVTLACLLGELSLVKRSRWQLWLLAGPMLMTMLAACFRLYPYGVDSRLVSHLAPQVFVLAGLGFATLLRLGPIMERLGPWLTCGVGAALLVLAGFGIAHDVRQPYARSLNDGDARAMTPALREFAPPGTRLYVLGEGNMPAVFQWYLRQVVPDVVFGPPPADDAPGDAAYFVLANSNDVPLDSVEPAPVAAPLRQGWESLTLIDHFFLTATGNVTGKRRCVVFLMKPVK